MHALYVFIPMKPLVEVESIEQRLSEEEKLVQFRVNAARRYQTFILISLNRDALDQGDESKILQDLDSIGVESWIVFGEYDILVSIVAGLAVEVLYDLFKYLHRQMKRHKIRSIYTLPAMKRSETNEKHKQETDSKKNLKNLGSRKNGKHQILNYSLFSNYARLQNESLLFSIQENIIKIFTLNTVFACETGLVELSNVLHKEIGGFKGTKRAGKWLDTVLFLFFFILRT